MRALLSLALLVGVLPALAQPAPEPLAAIRVDADGDRVPDRLGATVSLTGRASVDQGVFGTIERGLYVQDATGGVEISDGVLAAGPPIQAGDSLVVTGILRFRNATTYVEPVAIQRVPSRRLAPSPVSYDPVRAEALEGQLVEAEGMVVGQSQVSVGRALMVSIDDVLVVVFAFDDQPDPLSFDGLEAGDRIHVSGIAGQYDRFEPYTDSYQIYPRRPSDLRLSGLHTSAYRWIAVGAGVLFLLALGAAAMLRTEVRRRVAALRTSEARYRTLLERASDAIFIHDLDGDRAEGNFAAYTLLDLPSDVPIPSLMDSVAPEDAPRAQDHLRQLETSGNARTDLRILPPSGNERIIELESQVIAVDGDRCVLSLARDIGARLAYEKGLIAAREEAEEMARVKSSFLASMSHEIRTPLTAVIGFADLLMDEVDPENRGLVEAIEAGGRRLLATLNSVLDLARLDAQSESLHPAPLDVAAHVEQSIGLLSPLARERDLCLDVVTATEPIPAILDADALDRILTNLVGNAIKFTENGGVTVEVDADLDTVVLRVIDTGIGIADEFLPDLFTEFRQQSEGDARSHEGTGLGLAITQRLVELMGGTIAVDSQWGVGTAFTVTLPRGLPSGDGVAQEPEVVGA